MTSDCQIKRRSARLDPAGRPLTGRLRQALSALGILGIWFVLLSVAFHLTRGGPPQITAQVLAGITALFWLAGEISGGRDAPVWPVSALGITGALSLGFAASLGLPGIRGSSPPETMAAISGTAAIAMCIWLFRFRLPGLVSPVVTFAVVALFLTFYGGDRGEFGRVEGLSARGVIAALIDSPYWAGAAGLLGLGAAGFARRLDLKGDDFGLASARPLHLIGAGVVALVFGRLFGILPAPWDALALVLLVVAATAWALRINRFAVAVTAHLAMLKPVVLAVAPTLVLTPQVWASLIAGVLLANLVLWPGLHHIWITRGWTLGPAGHRPTPLPGLWWRYWPYDPTSATRTL